MSRSTARLQSAPWRPSPSSSGIDPRELALVPFGGAGPLHAVQIADELGMRRVLVPVASGVLSAFGLVVAERRRDLVESVLLARDDLTAERIAEAVERLAERGREELRADGSEPELRASYDLRYEGQAFELQIAGDPAPDPDALRRAFDRAHEERYGYADHDAGLELVSVRVAVALPGAEPRAAAWDGLPDDASEGPAVVRLPGSTLVVPEGWRARAEGDVVVMER
jgi:N-methylhydantoinase A/oxoprolinase/acetone carboxylase beta subunit